MGWGVCKTIAKSILVAVGLLITGCSDTPSEGTAEKDVIEEQLEEHVGIAVEAESDNDHEAKEAKEQEQDSAFLTAQVIHVVDGDTIDVVFADGREERVRFILVDTPETRAPGKAVQPFGPEATAFTQKHVENKQVQLELDVQERDRYGRLLAYIWVGDKMLNAMLIEEGLARVAVFPPNTKYVDEFRELQKEAQRKGVGIWSIENYAQEDGFDEEALASETETAASSDSDEKACTIKGSKNGIYHVPGSRYYEQTKHVVQWFCSVEEAEKAGFRAPKG